MGGSVDFSENKGFVEISKDDLYLVKGRLEAGNGKVLMYSPSMCDAYYPTRTQSVREISDSARFSLFDRPRINDDGISQKVDLKNSREYSFRKRYPSKDSDWESAYDGFKVLKFVDNWVFEIHGLFTTYAAPLIPEKGKAIYIPRNKGLEESALRYAIGTFVGDLKKQGKEISNFGQKQLDVIINHAMSDLVDGRILKNNIDAGQAADAMFGM